MNINKPEITHYEALVAARTGMQSRAFEELRDTLGYIENGGGNTIKIFQDDATRTWHVEVKTPNQTVYYYWGDSLMSTINKAHAEHNELIAHQG